MFRYWKNKISDTCRTYKRMYFYSRWLHDNISYDLSEWLLSALEKQRKRSTPSRHQKSLATPDWHLVPVLPLAVAFKHGLESSVPSWKTKCFAKPFTKNGTNHIKFSGTSLRNRNRRLDEQKESKVPTNMDFEQDEVTTCSRHKEHKWRNVWGWCCRCQPPQELWERPKEWKTFVFNKGVSVARPLRVSVLRLGHQVFWSPAISSFCGV